MAGRKQRRRSRPGKRAAMAHKKRAQKRKGAFHGLAAFVQTNVGDPTKPRFGRL